MTDLQKMRARALSEIDLPACGPHKRFVLDMAEISVIEPARQLTRRQAEHLARLAWRYRRQLVRDLVPAQDPDTLAQTQVTEYPAEEEPSL